MDSKRKNKSIFKIFAILLILIILIFSNKENQKKFINLINSRFVVSRDLEIATSIPVDTTINNIACYDDNIVVWQDNRLVRYSKEGSKEWEKEFNLSDPMVTFGEQRIFVYDKAIGDIYSLNPQGETLARFQIGLEIKNVVEVPEGFLMHYRQEKNEGIKILDNNGNLIADKLIENDNILAYCVDNSSKNYALSTMKLNDNYLKSEVQVYGMEGEFLSTTHLDDQLPLYLNFIDKNKLIAMSDRGLYFIDDGNSLWEKEIELTKDIFIANENICILYGNTFEAISYEGESQYKYSPSEECKRITTYKGNIVLYGSENIIALKDGKEVLRYKSEDSIYKIIGGKDNLVIAYANRIDIVAF